jgi:hypothetical protein
MNLYVYFQGGLGNQMFQYAAAVSALKEYPEFTNLKLDTSFYKDQKVKVVKNGVTGRSYDLDVFNITYTDIEESPEGAVMLKGWFQNVKNFENVKDQIRKEFTFRLNFQETTKEIEKDILTKKMPVSIHVRRGDYIYNQTALNYHGVLDKEYYDKCVEIMEKKYSNLDYYVFSEDIEWCKNNILVGHKNVIYVGEECNDYKDTGHLYLMTKCKAHIIANSSFSWWGAWLANSKFVIGPKVWYKGGDGTENIMKDLENWVQI